MKTRSMASPTASIHAAVTSRRRTHFSPPQQLRHRNAVCLEILEESGDAISFDHWRLSPFGAWLQSDILYSRGDRLTLRISLPHISSPLLVDGEVIRTETEIHPGMGIAFRKLRQTDRTALRMWMSACVLESISHEF